MKLLLLFTLTLLLQYSMAVASVTKGRIYVRSWDIDPSVKVSPRLIYKNTYDVIYETRKYELYLVNESAKDNPFISNYERLSVNLGTNQIEVSLSEKSVVRKRTNDRTTLLELRLALYELFLGRRYVIQNETELRKNSLKRMEMLERLEKKQQLANAQDASSSKNITSLIKSKDQLKEKSAETSSENTTESGDDNQENSDSKNLKNSALKSKESIEKLSKAENPKESADTSTNQTKAEENLSPSPNSNDSQTKEAVTNSEIAINNQENTSSKDEVDIVDSPAEKDSFILGFLGYSSFEGENKEIITTKTNFEYLSAGLRWTNEITKEASKGFFANLDEELRLLYRKSIGNSQYDIPSGRQIEFYMGAPLLGGGISIGVSGTYETTSFAAIKGITQGIKVVELSELLIGPEIKFLLNRSRFRIQGYIGHQIPIATNANIQADVELHKTQFEIDALDSSNWGLGIRYERYDIALKRTLWNSKVNPDQITVMMFMRF